MVGWFEDDEWYEVGAACIMQVDYAIRSIIAVAVCPVACCVGVFGNCNDYGDGKNKEVGLSRSRDEYIS